MDRVLYFNTKKRSSLYKILEIIVSTSERKVQNIVQYIDNTKDVEYTIFKGA